MRQEKVFANFACVANASSASISMALDELNRTRLLHRDDTIVLALPEATKWTYGAIALHGERETTT